MKSAETNQAEKIMTDTDLVEALRKELSEVSEELFETRQLLHQQHKVAAQVHRSLLPTPLRHLRIDIDVRFLPAEPLGSDYYQVRIPHDDPTACYITMCHVDGQGIAPALLASRISSEAKHFIEETFSPADMVHALNTFIYEHFHGTNIFASFMAARIDLNRRIVTYSGAGHPGAMLFRPDKGLVQRLTSQHRSIGVGPDILKGDSDRNVDMLAGDRLLFFAEGITRETSENGRPLGQSGLAEFAANAMNRGLFDMLDDMIEQACRFRDAPTKQDVTLVVAEIK
jgi:serine phosphatase RsbU (regulator of sigma subunit)